MISSRVRKQAVQVLLASSSVQMPMQGEETELVVTIKSYLKFEVEDVSRVYGFALASRSSIVIDD